MGSILGACVGSCFAGICCGACKQCGGQKSGPISRIPYIFLFFISGVFAIVMSLYGESELNLEFYSTTLCTAETCKGNGSVYRVAFCLFAFELLHFFIIGCGMISFHYLFFLIKFLLFIIALTLTFVIGDSTSSNDFFNGFANYFARYISAIYLLLQILILISWGYKINDYLKEKGNESSQSDPDNIDQDEDETSHSCNIYFWILGLSSLGLYILSIILCIFFFIWYGADSSCSLHRTLISLTIVICLINGAISGIRGDGSFFVSSVVSFYCTFLCFAALQADDNDTCNIFAGNRNTASLWIGYLITFLAIFYAAIRADQIGILWENNDNKNDDQEPLLNDQNKKEKDIENSISIDDDIVADSNYNDVDDKTKTKTKTIQKDNDNNSNIDNNENNEKMPPKKVQKISNCYFHFVMMLAACYMAMLFTNWGASTGSISTTGTESVIVNIVSQYATALLFWWTLLAPAICPSRFAQDDEDD